MALAIGDEVALVNNGGAGVSRRGNILFGIIISGGGPYTVVWENGAEAANIPGASLDKISSSLIIAQKYRFSDDSPAYAGFIVRPYGRQNNGSGDIDLYATLRAENGNVYEVLQSELVAIPGGG